jgi:hypothetical protein
MADQMPGQFERETNAHIAKLKAEAATQQQRRDDRSDEMVSLLREIRDDIRSILKHLEAETA